MLLALIKNFFEKQRRIIMISNFWRGIRAFVILAVLLWFSYFAYGQIEKSNTKKLEGKEISLRNEISQLKEEKAVYACITSTIPEEQKKSILNSLSGKINQGTSLEMVVNCLGLIKDSNDVNNVPETSDAKSSGKKD
jgi:hypothetical protein